MSSFGEMGAWRQSAVCKPFVVSSNEISSWVGRSWGLDESGDTWTTLGGPIITEVLQSLSESDDVNCRNGIFKAFINIFMTANASELVEEYASFQIRKININQSVPNLCEMHKTEFRNTFRKFFKDKDRQRSFRDGPFAKFIWTLCPNEFLSPTIALMGHVEFSVAFGSILLSGLEKAVSEHATPRDMLTLLVDIWNSLHFGNLIEQLKAEDQHDPESYEVDAMMNLVRLVGTVVLRLPHFPGAHKICLFGSGILRDVFDENAGFASLTPLCPSAFSREYCGSKGVGHAKWLQKKMIPNINWPILIDVVIRSQTLENRDCGYNLKLAVTSTFRSEMIKGNFPLSSSKEEAAKMFSSRYVDLCPLISIREQDRPRVWYLFHICEYNEKLVCPIAIFSSTSAIYTALKTEFEMSNTDAIKEYIETTNFIHVVNSISCREAFLRLLDRILQGIDPEKIFELRSSLKPELGSDIQSLCGHITKEHRYLHVFCDEKRIQDIVDHPVVWTMLWKKYGFQNQSLCSFSQRVDLSDDMLRLPDESIGVGEFLLRDLALDALIGHRSVVCEDEAENFIAAYIAKLVSRTIQFNWDRIDPRSDWELLSRLAEPFCDKYAAVISARPESILSSRLCPQHITFTALETMRMHLFLSSPISSFCEWLNPQGSGDSVMHRYCNDGCFDIAETYDSSPNPNPLDWIQRWGECGSPLDLIEVFQAVGTSLDIMEEIDSERFDTFVRSVFKFWKKICHFFCFNKIKI